MLIPILSQYFPNTFRSAAPLSDLIHSFQVEAHRGALSSRGARRINGRVHSRCDSEHIFTCSVICYSQFKLREKKSKQTLCLQVASHCGQNAETVPRSINQTRGQCLRDVKMAITQNDCHRLAVCLSAYPTIDQVKKPLK